MIEAITMDATDLATQDDNDSEMDLLSCAAGATKRCTSMKEEVKNWPRFKHLQFKYPLDSSGNISQ